MNDSMYYYYYYYYYYDIAEDEKIGRESCLAVDFSQESLTLRDL